MSSNTYISVQIRGMLMAEPPMGFVSGGKVFRKDDDSSHLPMFHQIEGIYGDMLRRT